VDADEFQAKAAAVAAENARIAEENKLLPKTQQLPAKRVPTYLCTSAIENEAHDGLQRGHHRPARPIRLRVTIDTSAPCGSQATAAMVDHHRGPHHLQPPIPQDLGFVDRTDPAHRFDHEIGFQVGKKQLGNIIDRCIKKSTASPFPPRCWTTSRPWATSTPPSPP
jgi:hypothetical protein